MQVEWINCLTGIRGKIELFPAELLAGDGRACVVLRIGENGYVRVCPDFRAEEVRLDGRLMLGSEPLEPGVPVVLQMKKSLLALCVPAEGSEAWAAHYRFPLWTIFEPETLEAVATVRNAAEIPAALERNGLAPSDCLAAPYGLPLCVPLAQIFELICGNDEASADDVPDVPDAPDVPDERGA